MKITLSLLFSLIFSMSFGQLLDKVEIDSIVRSIDKNQTFSKSVFDWNELINQTTDGGGELTVYHKGNDIKKITLQGGLSYGRITSIIYLLNNQPIFLIEKEENFPLENDELNYNKLEERFNEIIYVFGSSPDGPGEYQFESQILGQRVLSDNYCIVDELFAPIELAQIAIKKKL